jgi:8-oxo-dGTP diphosphatase
MKLYDELSQEDASLEGVVDFVDGLLDGDPDAGLDHGSAVLCTHRPVLPTVFDALEVPDVELEPGSMLVVHHRKGRVVATQHVAP